MIPNFLRKKSFCQLYNTKPLTDDTKLDAIAICSNNNNKTVLPCAATWLPRLPQRCSRLLAASDGRPPNVSECARAHQLASTQRSGSPTESAARLLAASGGQPKLAETDGRDRFKIGSSESPRRCAGCCSNYSSPVTIREAMFSGGCQAPASFSFKVVNTLSWRIFLSFVNGRKCVGTSSLSEVWVYMYTRS